jgi:hypothetical protein
MRSWSELHRPPHNHLHAAADVSGFAMNDALFSASRLKMQRAKKFICELEEELRRYRESNPLTASYDFSQNPPVMQISWDAITDLPGAIVGDAVHNMRTALDLMASELVRLKQHSDSWVYFPFSDNPASLDAAIKSKNFHKAGEDAVTLLKSFAPFRGGNEALRALHDLDIRDKHKALVLMGSAMNIEVAGSYDIDDPEKNNLSIIGHDIHYIFPESEPLGAKRVIETLKELMDLVNGILEAFGSMVALRDITP